MIFGQVKAEKIEVEDTWGHFQCGKYLDKMDQNTKIFKFTFFKKGSMKDFNSNCNHSENAFSNTYNWQFGGEIFFLLSAFQEGCGKLSRFNPITVGMFLVLFKSEGSQV